MIRIAIIGIVAVLLAAQFKNTHSEYSIYIGIATCFIIFFLSLQSIEVIIEGIKKIQSYLKMNPAYIEILIKILGITYISEFSASLCKDAGHAAIAGQIELVGKLSILAVSMPILLALLDTIHQFLKV